MYETRFQPLESHLKGVRKLIVPPDLGYGSRRNDPIPPDSTLIFEVQLLGIE